MNKEQVKEKFDGYIQAGEVLKLLKISRTTLCKMVERGEIKTIKVGKRSRYSEKSVWDLMEKALLNEI